MGQNVLLLHESFRASFVFLAREIRHKGIFVQNSVLLCTSTTCTKHIVAFSLQQWLHERATGVLPVLL
jgi:hypothetical protein